MVDEEDVGADTDVDAVDDPGDRFFFEGEVTGDYFVSVSFDDGGGGVVVVLEPFSSDDASHEG